MLKYLFHGYVRKIAKAYAHVRKKYVIGHLNKASINKITICANFFQSPILQYLVYHQPTISSVFVFFFNTSFFVVWDTWVTRFTLFVNLWQTRCKMMRKQICTLNKVKVPYSNENKQKILTLRHCRPIVHSELGGNTKWLKRQRLYIWYLTAL